MIIHVKNLILQHNALVGGNKETVLNKETRILGEAILYPEVTSESHRFPLQVEDPTTKKEEAIFDYWEVFAPAESNISIF